MASSAGGQAGDAPQPAATAGGGAPAPDAAGVDAHPLGPLEKALQNTAETLNTLSLGVHDFTYEAQPGLFAAVNQLVRDLSALDAAAAGVDAHIPVDVLEAIDRGRNPELCTYQMLEACADASAVSRGKLDCVATFRAALDAAVVAAGGAPPAAADVAAAQRPREYARDPAAPPADLAAPQPAAQPGAPPALDGAFLDHALTASAADAMKDDDIFALPA